MGAITVTILMLLAAAGLLSLPLWAAPGQPYALQHSPAPAFTERDALLEALSELELAFGGGKLSPEDYERQKAGLQREYLTQSGETG